MYQHIYFVYIVLNEGNIVCIFWVVSNNISHNCSDKIISSAATVEGEMLVIIIAVGCGVVFHSKFCLQYMPEEESIIKLSFHIRVFFMRSLLNSQDLNFKSSTLKYFLFDL